MINTLVYTTPRTKSVCHLNLRVHAKFQNDNLKIKRVIALSKHVFIAKNNNNTVKPIISKRMEMLYIIKNKTAAYLHFTFTCQILVRKMSVDRVYILLVICIIIHVFF